MGTEVITLGLEEGGGETLGAVSVEERESGREGGSRDTPESTLGDDSAPSGLGLVDCGSRKRVSDERKLKKDLETYQPC